jgi:N-acetylmuramic acid 6-phosphate etherase
MMSAALTTEPDKIMSTEQINPRYIDLDTWSAGEMIAAMFEEQVAAAAAVRGALGEIAAAVEDAVPALQRGGRIVYAGAGTSGRIGVQDGSELPPTFNWPADRILFAVAGGLDALVKSVEGAEDDEAAGAKAMTDANVSANDVVIGMAASGTTPFTIGVLRAAAAAGAVTIAVANNQNAPLFNVARHRIFVATGSEVIAGSTRMKAGTAQKIALNLFSTAVMVKMGRVYRGLMVDMSARSHCQRNPRLLKRQCRRLSAACRPGCEDSYSYWFRLSRKRSLATAPAP